MAKNTKLAQAFLSILRVQAKLELYGSDAMLDRLQPAEAKMMASLLQEAHDTIRQAAADAAKILDFE
jgi:hypothetical protein